MKKNIILFGALTIMIVASCNNQTETKQPVETNQPVETIQPVATTPPPAATPEKKPVVVEPASQKEGTTIKMNENGVSIENKAGTKKNNVKISTDSTSIEISRPK